MTGPARGLLLALVWLAAMAATAPRERAERVPPHVANWAVWGATNETPGPAADWVAAHVTLLQADAAHTRLFKAAGGRTAIAYTDPTRVIPARREALWDTPERAWLHDVAGARIHYDLAGWGVQNQLNPADPATAAAYRKLTQSIADSAPYDYVWVDDISFDLENAFWRFSAPPVEIRSEAQYTAGIARLLTASALPPIVSGFSNPDRHRNDVSGNMLFLPYAAGGIDNEGCLRSTAAKPETLWAFDENTLSAITRAAKIAVCWGQSRADGDTRADRLFFFASWLLTYDPRNSIAFENFASKGNLYVFAEQDIVPRDPVQTARGSIAELRASRGYYRREFRRCFQRAVPIGPCAAVVNPTAGEIDVSDAEPSFDRELVLDDKNAFDGGAATWQPRRHARLAPGTALVLRRNLTPADREAVRNAAPDRSR
jgi:hypothetical protein